MIIASGGILERQTAHGPEVAIIYRERYGPEWGLPKGKLEAGESLEQAAIREIEEETGYKGIIRSLAGETAYNTENGKKKVTFWLMDAVEGGEFKSSEEIRDIAWLPYKLAVKKVSHKDEKELLKRVYTRRKRNRFLPVIYPLIRITRRWKRLEAEIDLLQRESEYKSATLKKAGSSDTWLKASRDLLQDAQSALIQCDIDKGWKQFMAARRMKYRGLVSTEERKVAAVVLFRESIKIKPWRQRVVTDLLTDRNGAPPPNENIYEAAFQIDEHYSNQAYIQALLSGYSLTLVLILALLAAAILFIGYNNLLFKTDSNRLVMNVIVFGILGATLSATLKLPRTSGHTSIPEAATAWRITFLRIAMGAGSALLIYVVLKSNLSRQLLGDFFNEPNPPTVYLLAFVAGFSERLVLRVVGQTAG